MDLLTVYKCVLGGFELAVLSEQDWNKDYMCIKYN